jgi:hypothetical protein
LCTGANFSSSDATLFLPNGGVVSFPVGQRYDPETRLLLQKTMPSGDKFQAYADDDGSTGVRVIHADGAQDIYGFELAGGVVPSDD